MAFFDTRSSYVRKHFVALDDSSAILNLTDCPVLRFQRPDGTQEYLHGFLVMTASSLFITAPLYDPARSFSLRSNPENLRNFQILNIYRLVVDGGAGLGGGGGAGGLGGGGGGGGLGGWGGEPTTGPVDWGEYDADEQEGAEDILGELRVVLRYLPPGAEMELRSYVATKEAEEREERKEQEERKQKRVAEFVEAQCLEFEDPNE
ncbi:hypothetical protein B0H16DRAFT_1876882 [Mycena metata]|uniref:Uncharacterized protein n=1 Tax=Mycena metata TaxID=1033252 RepID=A0AAD7KF98_9AGAR|nr:hypothetical protein B0H16DRAFT_1876882 [Mycena metata]